MFFAVVIFVYIYAIKCSHVEILDQVYHIFEDNFAEICIVPNIRKCIRTYRNVYTLYLHKGASTWTEHTENFCMMTSSNGNIFRVAGSRAICAGNSPVTGEFPHKGQWRGALTFFLICAWISGSVNNHEAGDLRRNRAHYDVTVIKYVFKFKCTSPWDPWVKATYFSLLSVAHFPLFWSLDKHFIDVIMTTMASQITSLMVVHSIVYSGADQRKHQSSASLAFVRGIHRDRWISRTKGQ